MPPFLAAFRFALLLPFAFGYFCEQVKAQNQVAVTQQPVQAKSSCDLLGSSADRKACWENQKEFNCFLLKDADEQLACTQYQLVSPTVTDPDMHLPGIPDGATANVPPDWKDMLNSKFPMQRDLLPLPGYEPGEVKG